MSPPLEKRRAGPPQTSPYSNSNDSATPRKVSTGQKSVETERQLFPANVDTLTRAQVPFTESKADLRVWCPECKGTLLMHKSDPWHICLNHCELDRAEFGTLLNRLGVKRE